MKHQLLLLMVLSCAATAAAQTSDDNAAPSTQPSAQRPAVAIGAGGVASLIGNGVDARLVFSFPRPENRAIEVFGGAYDGNDASGVMAVYGVQWRRPISASRSAKLDPFITYGIMGAVVRYETTSCTNRQCTPHSTTALLPPLMPLVGAGATYVAAPRLALRFDYEAGFALFVPIGVRAGISASIPLGRSAPSHQ